MSFLEAVTGAWGLLPLAVPAAVFVAVRIGGRLFPNDIGHRALAGAIVTIAIIVGSARLLGAFQIFTTATATFTLGVLTVVSVFLRGTGWKTQSDGTWQILRITFATREAWPMFAVGGAASGLALLAARWLPIWHWDALGYHLPYVNFFLGAHGPQGVPTNIPFLSTYPHNIELFTIAVRAMLPDDRLVDAVQVPLGILGAMAVAGIARLQGAVRAHAVAAGCAWLAVPAIFLQLPSNYVDVGSSAFLLTGMYFLLAPVSSRTLVLAGVALGLFLGSKPSAPLTTAFLGLILVVRGLRAKKYAAIGVVILLVLLFGAESFVTNLVRFGNPGWPVRVDIGPLHLPGPLTLQQVVLDPSPELSPARGPFVWRLLESWTNLDAPPVFDMRIGGYGPLFLVALPFALLTLVRARSVVLALTVLSAFLNPCPTWARFVMPFPGLVFALAAPTLPLLPVRIPFGRALVLGAAAVVAALQIRYAWPGLALENPLHGIPYHGPPLTSYANMTDDERERALSADGPPAPFIDIRKRVADDETYALEARTRSRKDETYTFDTGDILPYLAWDDFRYRVMVVPDLPDDQIADFLVRERVRVFAAADDSPLAHWAEANPDKVVRAFSYQSVPCAVYERR